MTMSVSKTKVDFEGCLQNRKKIAFFSMKTQKPCFPESYELNL